jgi:calcineurin-like phosphoesterase family protein
MNIWLIADTHFGHEKMVTNGYRPAGFEMKILDSIRNNFKHGDVLLHLGDVSFKDENFWTSMLRGGCPGKLWLTLGNHDKSAEWYLTRGFDFVGESLSPKYQGKHILFSHMPRANLDGYDFNIHGHLHDGIHHEGEFGLSSKHINISIEGTWAPRTLKAVLKSVYR